MTEAEKGRVRMLADEIGCNDCPAANDCSIWSGAMDCGAEIINWICAANTPETVEKDSAYTDHRASDKKPPDGRTGSERGILPIPCTVGFEDWTVKRWFQKINEELDGLKAEMC